jgi:hypothetical protein
MARGRVIALVQAARLRRCHGGLGALHHHGLQGGGQALGRLGVGPSPGRAQRAARRCDDQATFAPWCPPAGGWRPPRSPPGRALPLAVSAACPCQATPSRASPCATSAAPRRSQGPRWHHGWQWRWPGRSSPNADGRRFHWPPVRRRNMRPWSPRRPLTRRCPLALAGSWASKSCWSTGHTSSGTAPMVGAGVVLLCCVPLLTRLVARTVIGTYLHVMKIVS